MANYYIAQSAQGTGDGLTSANAKAASFFNTGANWSATPATADKICPGDTVWVVGTISTPLVFQGSGATGNPVTLKWEPGAKLSAGTWATAALLCEGDNYAGLKHDIVIDGYADGRIEATASGTGMTYSSCGYGVRCVGTSQLEIKNLRVLDLFVRTAGTDTNTPGTLISCANAVNAAMADISVHDCILQNGFIGVATGYNLQGTSNVLVYNNSIRYVNWGIQCGSEVAGATISNLQIYGNTISDFANWDEPGTNFHHHNAIFVWTNNSDTSNACTGLRIYGNTIGPGFGTYATSGIYVSAPGHRDETWIYNNVFSSVGSNPSNGDIFVVPGPGATTRIYNNTHFGTEGIAIGYGGDHGGAQTLYLRNNIVRGTGGGGKVGVYVSYQDLVTIDSDYNSFSGLSTSPTGFSRSSGNTASFRTWAEWQAYGYDANSQYETNPLLDSNGRPGVGSPALGAGADLSSFFTDDYEGTTRVAPWDMGAYEGEGETPPAATGNPLAFRSSAMLAMGAF